MKIFTLPKIGLIIIAFFWVSSVCYGALTPGQIYTIEVSPIDSNGKVGSLAASTTSTADLNGKISFFLDGVPTTSDGYNFLLVVIKDSDGTIVRRSLAPAPSPGSTVNLGVSPMTEAQSQAMLGAMETAGSDDPIMVLFGFTLVRSGGYIHDDISHLGSLGRVAVRGENGFNNYLEGKIGADKMAVFRSAVQTSLAQYTAKIKEAVDHIADSQTAKNYRGEAAALLSELLIGAASEAGFDPGYINAAIRAMGDKADDYLANDGATMSPSVLSSIDAIMSATYMKIQAECVRKKYTSALTVLDASQSQVERVNTAVTNLSNAMLTAFQGFEALFENEENLPSISDIDQEQQNFDQKMQQAFNNFMQDIASTNAEIDTMVDKMKSGFCGGDQNCETLLNSMKDSNSDGNYTDGTFTFWDMSGNARNWPITMVVPVTWVVANYSDTFTYTRDTIQAPQCMDWLDSDDNSTNGIDHQRHDFQAMGLPGSLAALFSLREDIEIINTRRWAGEMASSCDMTNATYNNLDPGEQTDAYELSVNGTDLGRAYNLEIITIEDSTSEDDLAGINATNFTYCSVFSPYLLASEIEGLEDLRLSRLAQRKAAIGPAEISEAQRQALVDTATMPDF
ncbi:hypothetical protein KFV02_01380 [Desulfohalobiaceae bacterium Ax17]|uniref:hypothetical protein n=1 Tax=Desulfovulcanus ferrireducens TaxID=2831190 RepID=UPI00207B9B5F|nr:hypothetical protein [Desulfovulcanus ferrireducens]MBT8762584.1 hypothetical protein [Desulfovulcanus ferrireducens]